MNWHSLYNCAVLTLSNAETKGFGVQTLYNWRDTAKQRGRPESTSEQWSAEAKLATGVLERSPEFRVLDWAEMWDRKTASKRAKLRY